MCMLYPLEMIPLTIDCICIAVFYSVWNRAIFQLVILKIYFFTQLSCSRNQIVWI